MNNIKIGDSIWHPCNMDIIEHKITGIRQYEDSVQYETKAVRNIGASGKLELLLSHKENKIIFIGYVHGEDSVDYESGLQDFVEGYYYIIKEEAELKFYEQQRTLTWSSTEKHKRLYEQSKQNLERVELLVKALKEKIKSYGESTNTTQE